MTIYAEDARLYDLIYGGDDAKVLAFIRWLLADLKITHSHQILDMGAGTGSILIPLTKDGYKIKGMEPFEKMLNYAKVKAGLAKVNILIEQGSFQSLSEDNQFKFIFALNGPLHYIQPQELERVFSKLFKALRPGGYLLLDTINFLSLVKNYQYPEIMDFELDGVPATAMIHHSIDLDKEKWYNRVILFYKDKEYQKFEDIQEMSVFTRTHLQFVAQKVGFEYLHFFSSYDDKYDTREYGGRLLVLFSKP